ncbi:MAG: P1 family peptidase, partial [Trueperaceae bacterium]
SHALLLTGGSAFGLAAADGVMRWLEARGHGQPTPFGPVPIVPAAVLYDLGVGSSQVRPDAGAGEHAAEVASDGPVLTGRVGAGTGATAFKLDGFDRAVPTGIGTAAVRLGAVTVAAIAVSNAVGGLRDPDGDGAWLAGRDLPLDAVADLFAPAGTATSLVAVVTDARLEKAACRALAPAGHVGIIHVTRPSHTAHDGDTVFVAATGVHPSPGTAALGVAVQRVVAAALLQGVRAGGAA